MEPPPVGAPRETALCSSSASAEPLPCFMNSISIAPPMATSRTEGWLRLRTEISTEPQFTDQQESGLACFSKSPRPAHTRYCTNAMGPPVPDPEQPKGSIPTALFMERIRQDPPARGYATV